MIKVLVVSLSEILLEGLNSLISEIPGYRSEGSCASTLEECLARYAESQPDLLVADCDLFFKSPVNEGALENLRTAVRAPILLISPRPTPRDVYLGKTFGVAGFASTETGRIQLNATLDLIVAGFTIFDVCERVLASVLTKREVDVLACLARGLTNPDISVALGVSEHTVKTHVVNVLGKLEAANRTEAVALGFEMGYLTNGNSLFPPLGSFRAAR